jgi:hypothetical protein
MDDTKHSYEEIRDIVLDLLAGRTRGNSYELNQYQNLMLGVGAVFRNRISGQRHEGHTVLSDHDSNLFLEVFWGLFRDGIITLGLDDSNRNFPFFRVSSFGKRLLDGKDAYFFHDVSSYEKIIRIEIPSIDKVTLIYLKEAMQAFRSGCILSTTVMLGVAAEHTFLLLTEVIDQNPTHQQTYGAVAKQRSILPKVNKFKDILDKQSGSLPYETKENLDTHFMGILHLIRTFRNQSGHPSGAIVDREQAYILLQLFIPYCKKMYQLMDYFRFQAASDE